MGMEEGKETGEGLLRVRHPPVTRSDVRDDVGVGGCSHEGKPRQEGGGDLRDV